MKRMTILSVAALVCGVTAVAFAGGNGAVVKDGDTYFVRTAVNTVALQPISSDIFRVYTVPAGVAEFIAPRTQAAVLEANGDSVCSILTPSYFALESPTTKVIVDRASGRVRFENAVGKELLSENSGVDNSGALKRVSFLTPSDHNFYGAGERGHSLRLNGDSLGIFNRQNYGYTSGDERISQMGITMPYFTSDRGYGVLMDDYNQASLVLGEDSIVYESQTSKPLSYYFINGDGNLKGAVKNFTSLTGRQPLPPFWTMGYITSKYGYHNQQEALGAVDSLKQRGFPLDGIVFDLYWYGVETDMGRLEWNKKQFPDHKAMLDSLNSMGVHTVLISQPYINKIGAIDNYNFLNSKGLLTKDANGDTNDVTTWVGEAGMFDVSNPETREWLWNRLRPLTAEGLSGWWGDLGEPEVHPLTIVHANGEKASEYHNVYGNEWSKLIYDGLRKDFPEMRPMLMMRGGTTGLQRYAVFPWTTDVSRSWGGFEPQVNLMLNSGLSGLGYMGSDLGGFAVDPENPYQPELYVRWLESGVFSPVMRTHAQYKPEPYHYPAQLDILRRLIKMRYEWLPYNYTLAYENARYGYPLARPLNFESEDKSDDLSNIEDEYMWGNEVLVAPVFKSGARSRVVKFPAGEWINWHNPSLRYKGGSKATVAAPLGQIPLFVRAGSFIPQYDGEIANTSEYDPSRLTVKYFPSTASTSYTLFEDDRKSPESIENNEYQLINFEAHREGAATVISMLADGNYTGCPKVRQIKLQIIGTKKPIEVQGAKWSYNAKSRVLTLDFAFSRDKKVSFQ